MSKEMREHINKVKNFGQFLNERLHTKQDAEKVLSIIHQHISKNASLIGGFGKGNETSEHDIDILITDVEFNEEFKQKMIKLLNAESVEDTNWGGLYFNNTNYGDVDVFYTTEDFDY
jgi:predicted nucleotidyltransferase